MSTKKERVEDVEETTENTDREDNQFLDEIEAADEIEDDEWEVFQ